MACINKQSILDALELFDRTCWDIDQYKDTLHALGLKNRSKNLIGFTSHDRWVILNIIVQFRLELQRVNQNDKIYI